MYYNGGIKLEKNNTKKLELPISSKTGEPLKPFIKPRDVLLSGFIYIALGFLFWWWASYPWAWETFPVFTYFLSLFLLVEGCIFIFRAKLGNKQVLAHQIIVLISDLFMLFIGIVSSIILWSIPGLLAMLGSIVIILLFTLGSIIRCLYWLVKLEKYKVKN